MNRSFINSMLVIVTLLALTFGALGVSPAEAAGPKVAVFYSDGSLGGNDVITKLTATGSFSQIDDLSPTGCGSATPSLATLQQYSAVMVWSNCSFSDPIAVGDVLADYIDGGGRVVVATFAFWTSGISLGIDGRFDTGGYSPLTRGGQNSYTQMFLVADLPGDPLLAGVSSFDGGAGSYYNTPVSLVPGATQVAHWSNGEPLIAYMGNVVALNFYPVSSDIGPDWWNSATDGARLMANALGGSASPTPGAFGKTGPASGTISQSTSLTMTWGASAGTTSYEYCLDEVPGSTCDTTWIPLGNVKTIGQGGLAANSTFYWQVRAVNAGGTTEADGGTWWTYITDNTAPVVTAPMDMTVEATSAAGAVVNFSATATDETSPDPVVACVPASGSTFPLGTTQVDCSATDDAGNTANASFNVKVQDTIPPTLNLPANMTVEATNASGAVVSFSASTTDTVAPANPVVTCIPSSGSTFPLAPPRSTVPRKNSASNTVNGSFTIKVQDTTAPALNLPVDFSVPRTLPAGAVVIYNATATDAVGPANPIVTCVPASGSTFPVGTTTVNCSAIDTAGNTANGSFHVTVAMGTQLLLNSGFDQTNLFPKVWTYSVLNKPFSSLSDCTVFISPNCSLRLVGERLTRVVTQTISRSGLAGDQYSFGLFSKALNIPGGGNYKVEVSFFNRMNRVMLTQTLNFINGTHDFQSVNGTLTVPGAYTKIVFRISLQTGKGTAWFDDAFLIQIP